MSRTIAEERDPAEPDDQHLIASLVRGAALVSDVCASAAEKHALTVQQATLLCALSGRSLIRMVELARLLGISRSSTTEMVDRAERASTVARAPDSRDGRQQIVRLTERGDLLGASYRATVTEHLAKLLDVLTPEERDLVTDLARRFVADNRARDTWPEPTPETTVQDRVVTP